MKRMIAIILTVLLVVSLAACSGSKENPSTASATEEAVVGGWVVYSDTAASAMPNELFTAYTKVTADAGDVSYAPVAYLGSQAVSGTNYALLCAVTPKDAKNADLKVLIIYVDLDGNATLSKESDFNIADYTESAGKVTEKNLAGGWTITEDAGSASMPDYAQAAFDKAVASFDGNKLEPMALLGTQVVSGTNYAFLCRSTMVTEEPVSNLQVVTVYADLNENASITNICTLDIADFNQ